ncbi:hypothetical protein TNCV_520161 [Trichonephila clavipes]|nr:hypothetical protein TNCV_520161 [Trichonephila clavipes]
MRQLLLDVVDCPRSKPACPLESRQRDHYFRKKCIRFSESVTRRESDDDQIKLNKLDKAAKESVAILKVMPPNLARKRLRKENDTRRCRH